MTTARDEELALLFTEAHTHHVWLDQPVPDALLERAYELAKMAPTAMNCQPLRVVFVKTAAGKERLKPTLSEGNVAKTMAAPVTAILAWDPAFHEHMDKLFPIKPDAKAYLAGLPTPAREGMASMNATLQCGYFLLAARALGLDCGPMGGFDRAKVDAELLAEKGWRSIMLVNLGHGDPAKLHPRLPRLAFDEATTAL